MVGGHFYYDFFFKTAVQLEMYWKPPYVIIKTIKKLKTTNSVKHIAMNSSFVTPQAIAGSERNQFKLSMFIAMEQDATLKIFQCHG